MGAVSVSMQCPALVDSVFSMLDYSWYAQPILNHSIASCVPLVESSGTSAGETSETVLRPSEADMTSGTASSSIDEIEMRKVFDLFDDNRDGLISVEELRRYMRCCGKDVSDAEAKSMVSSVDSNLDGGVDFEEFLSLYRTNCSGEATGEDHKRTREDEEEALVEAFHVFDRNHDGFITARELQTVLLELGMPEGRSLPSCEKMIRNVDRDGDGQCDIREFQEMMSAQSF